MSLLFAGIRRGPNSIRRCPAADSPSRGPKTSPRRVYECGFRNLSEGCSANAVALPQPSPGRDSEAPSAYGRVVFRRRRQDWGGTPRSRIDLAAATATLEADYSLTAAHSDDVVSLSEAIAERLGVNG